MKQSNMNPFGTLLVCEGLKKMVFFFPMDKYIHPAVSSKQY